MPPQRHSPELKARKMRKGTHSCFECRRRKIRCIFPQDNTDICTECFARGSKCIDQEHAAADAIVDQRKNLRERVSRLEALVESLLDDRDDRTSQTARPSAEALRNLRGEPFPHSPPISDVPDVGQTSNDAPLLQMFNNDVISRADEGETPSTDSMPVRQKVFGEIPAATNVPIIDWTREAAKPPETFDDPQSAATKEKYERTRRALLAPLPPYDKIVELSNQNSDWWTTFRQKCPGTSTKYATLKDFATEALTKGLPAQLGLLVLGLGISEDQDNIEKYLALVDKEVLSDDEYASTLEGMECLILQSKCYADIGQPRKGWLCYRKGLAYAQLMGLHRNHSMSPERDSIWWVLYQGDRFISLLLGLPYGIPDSHCDLELRGAMADHTKSPFAFLANISKLAGKVIDRTQGTAPSSFSSTLDIDSELERVSSLVPPGWWDTAELEAAVTNAHRPGCAADLRERLLSQMAYHQIRVYLHLPFMLQSANNPRYEYSRTTCLNSAREMLRLYQLLRAGTGQPLYECKAVDFLGFTASILVLLGLLGYGKLAAVPNPLQEENDWRMIEISMDIFQRASTEKGGKVAAQSYKVLEQLSLVRNMDMAACKASPQAAKIIIPYFGTISVRCGSNFTQPLLTPSATNSTVNTPPSMSANSPNVFPNNNLNHLHKTASTPATTPSSTSPTHSRPSAQPLDTTDPFLVYDGFYMPSNLDATQASAFGGGGGGGEGGLGTFSNAATSGNAWSMGAMDIDQDWNWFLNDANSMGMGMGGGGGIGGQGSQPNNGMPNPLHGTFFP